MKILILGYSSLCKRKIIPILRDKLSKAEFYICSKSQKPQNIGELKWYRSYVEALKNSQANLVYISLMNSQKIH